MTQENALPLGGIPDDDAHSIAIELEAHDVSRFEWCVAVPLPAHEPLKYTVQAEFQGFTRLEEPQMVGANGDRDATVNLLRQQVLVLQQMLGRARQGGIPPLAGCPRLSLVRSEGGAQLHAGPPRLAEADDRPSSGMVPRNHHLAARSAQSESGTTLRVTLINHVHRGVIAPQPQFAAAGVRHVRQLFRYDLTPLCTRLHDPIKSIPVLDAGSGRAKFVGAPRRYQMPIRVLAATLEDRRELNASLILDKQGIVRIEYHASGNR